MRVPVDEGMIENAALQGVRFLDGLRSVRAVKFAAAVVLAIERNPAVQVATAARHFRAGAHPTPVHSPI